MKRVLALILVLTLIALTGCQESSDEMTIETDDGSVEIKTNMQDVDESDWCPEGGEWTMAASGVEGDASAEWKVVKLETSGEYAGLCHVTFTAEGPDGQMDVDYWFDETGKNGFVEMEQNGQKVKQEFHN